MFTSLQCKINNRIQEILGNLDIEELSAVQLARYLHPEPLKDSDSRPGLPLRRLLRDNKVLGAYQEVNGRWFIQRIENYQKICSAAEVQMICGYRTPKSVYDLVAENSIPYQSTPGAGDEGIYFHCEDVDAWNRNRTLPKSPKHPNSASLSEKPEQSITEQIQRLRIALPPRLRPDLDKLELQLSTTESTPNTFWIPEGNNRITSRDREYGRLRITKRLKPFFPSESTLLKIELGGKLLRVRYEIRDPRSNILYLGRKAMDYLKLEVDPRILVGRVSDHHYRFAGPGGALGEISAQSTLEPILDADKTMNIHEPTFEYVCTVGEAIDVGLPRLDALARCGIYRIEVPTTYRMRLFDLETVKANKNVTNPWAEERLHSKWIDGTRIIYIGLAGARSPRSLRKRLSDLIRHAKGQTNARGPHKGGEIIWQLKGYEDFAISVYPSADPPVPRQIERHLLAEFIHEYGKLPFGNRQF